MERLTAERDALSAERDALAAERDCLADSLLRLRAEFDNYRKRASRELVEARVRAEGDLLTELLPVLDNLERALDAAEHHEEGKVLGGVRMTRDMFANLLTRAGVEEVEGVGAPFDPLVHEAMLVQPSEHDDGAVAAVLQRGYRQGDRVLRPARVAVSTGPGGSAGDGAATSDGATPGCAGAPDGTAG
jgi:molecular chaperone GrpE